MTKKALGIQCVIFGTLFGALAIHFCSNVAQKMTQINTGMGIIGSADSPTLMYIAHRVMEEAPVFQWLLPLLILFLGTLIAWVVLRKK